MAVKLGLGDAVTQLVVSGVKNARILNWSAQPDRLYADEQARGARLAAVWWRL